MLSPIEQAFNLYFPDSEFKQFDTKTSIITALTDFFLENKEYINLAEIQNNNSNTIDFSISKHPNLPVSDLAIVLYNSPYIVLNCIGAAVYIVSNKLTKTDKIAIKISNYNRSAVCNTADSDNTSLWTFSNLKSVLVNKLVAIKGVVVKVSNVKPAITSLSFYCNYCQSKNNSDINSNDNSIYKTVRFIDNRYTPPTKCNNCCRSNTYIPIKETASTIDYQIIAIQEELFNTNIGTNNENSNTENSNSRIPRIVEVELTDNLVESCIPGDVITVTGIVKPYPTQLGKDYNKLFQLYIEAINIEGGHNTNNNSTISNANTNTFTPSTMMVNSFEENERILISQLSTQPDIFKQIVHSICPGIYGHEIVKAALCLALFGGVTKTHFNNKLTSRGDCHILIVGDPGMGKCLHPNTEILLSTGDVCRIGQLVGSNLKSKYSDDTFYERKETSILSMNLTSENALHTETIKSDIQWKLKTTPQLIKLRTNTGKEIFVTPNHPFFVCKNGELHTIYAEKLQPNVFIATPRKIHITGNDIIEFGTKFNDGLHINMPHKMSDHLARLIGIFSSSNCVFIIKNESLSIKCSFSNNSRRFIQNYKQLIQKFLKHFHFYSRRSSFVVSVVCIHCYNDFKSFLHQILPSIFVEPSKRRVSSQIMCASDQNVITFLKATYNIDGFIYSPSKSIALKCNSYSFLTDIQLLLLRFEIVSFILEKSLDSKFLLVIQGKTFIENFMSSLGVIFDVKFSKLFSNVDLDIIPDLHNIILQLRSQFHLPINLFNNIDSYLAYERGKMNISRSNLRLLIQIYDNYNIHSEKLSLLTHLAFSDIFWDRIISIDCIKSDTDWVYDLQVPRSHNYIANGIFVHNSQLLKAVSHLSPRGVYVCGNTTTTSGLTVSLSKESGGDYALEAGALVLADQGVCCIDEFDKMKSEHDALLEAMEQQSVSIAKAGIVCNLVARTSVIAAANPAGGHYNHSKSVTENLKTNAALLSRFDIIFVLLDKPNRIRDQMLSDHVLALHSKNMNDKLNTPYLYSQNNSSNSFSASSTQRSLQDRLVLNSHKFNPISSKILRKYIALAKTQVLPKLSFQAKDILKQFYLYLRKTHQSLDSTPITTRQLESLIRLSEARARMEFREIVTVDDAIDCIEILKESMLDMKVDDFSTSNLSKRKQTSKSKQTASFLTAADRFCEQKGNAILSENELHNIADSIGLKVDNFDYFLDILNSQNYLLKKKGNRFLLASSRYSQ